ncbi:hypothetical protein GCM10007392_23200 [Saccharospirillum salsuginis]|uniref:Uncharacterized protein n=1 Tax=Saccharospirillum salsuginis TaxID=418750 RepID=A0A918K8X2_9GAMM|nr:hypothetical protein GCM10007392_23200 [Saccharospirillum salsuginis]
MTIPVRKVVFIIVNPRMFWQQPMGMHPASGIESVRGQTTSAEMLGSSERRREVSAVVLRHILE